MGGLHTLRHTAATVLFRGGWNPVQVQKFLGHHSPAFTLGTYVHLLPDDLPEPSVMDVGASPVEVAGDAATPVAVAARQTGVAVHARMIHCEGTSTA